MINYHNYYNTKEAQNLLKISLLGVIKRVERGHYKDVIKCRCNHEAILIAKKEIDEEVESKANS